MKSELPLDSGKVISIETARKTIRERRLRGECQHLNIVADESLTHITCKECNQTLNPVWWIMMLAGEWDNYMRLRQSYLDAKAEYEKRQKVKCRNCGKFTNLR